MSTRYSDLAPAEPPRSFGSIIVEQLAPVGRNIGVDTARGLALFGMMATHIIPLVNPDGTATTAALFAGRASALFAVIAGVSVVLSTRGALSKPHASDWGGTRGWVAAAAGLVVRGLIIAFFGLILGSISTRIAIILVNYGVMFVVAAFLVKLGPRVLGSLAAVWLVGTPFISFAVRSSLGLQPAYEVPHLLSLADPGQLFIAITLTGYYPVLQWMGFILLGMALGHARWQLNGVCVGALFGGAGLALAAKALSTLLIEFKGREALEASIASGSVIGAGASGLDTLLIEGNFGTTPTDTGWWLAVAAPHTGTPLDMLHVSGVAVAAIGACCLVANLLARVGAPGAVTSGAVPTVEGSGRVWLCFLSAPGAMPLTIYSAHVVFLEITAGFPLGPWPEYALHVYVAMFAALLWKTFINRRGPLENVVSSTSSTAVRMVLT